MLTLSSAWASQNMRLGQLWRGAGHLGQEIDGLALGCAVFMTSVSSQRLRSIRQGKLCSPGEGLEPGDGVGQKIRSLVREGACRIACCTRRSDGY